MEVIDPCQAKSLISHARERTPLELHKDKPKPVSRISNKFLNHPAKQISVQDTKTRFYTHVVQLCLGKLQSKSVMKEIQKAAKTYTWECSPFDVHRAL